jgi:hypothetical protein
MIDTETEYPIRMFGLLGGLSRWRTKAARRAGSAASRDDRKLLLAWRL